VGNLKKKYDGPLDQMSRAGWAGSVDSIGKVWGAVAWVYDKRGRLKADTSWTGPVARVTTRAYDTYERPVTMNDALGAWTTKYETERGIPDTLITPWSDTLSYTFDSRRRPISTRISSAAGRMARSISYTTAGELKELKHTANPAGQSGYAITRYERLPEPPEPDTMPGGPSLVPLWTELHGAGGALDSLRDSVVYDGWQRVNTYVRRELGGHYPLDSLTYTFDPTGNVNTPLGGEFYHKVTGRLQTRKVNSILHFYTYDRTGNLTQESWAGNTRTYQYDALNQLRSVRHNGTLIVRYGYDVLGRRIAKRVYSSITGGTVGFTRYKYHGGHVAFETDSAGSSIGWRYTWGMGTDDLMAMRDAAGNHYYTAKDKLGSIRALAERDGTWKYSTRYGPYGEPKLGAGTDPGLRYRWTGREYDAETGWYFHRSRYYAPTMLRFVQEDKIGYGGGTNLYAYVAGAVLDARDPSGMLMSWADIGKGFIPFCTFGGSCLGADGSVTGEGPEIYLDGVSWGGGGGGGRISGIAIASITGAGYGSLLPGRVEGGDKVATQLIAECRNNEACNESIELWEAVPGGFAYVRTTVLVTDAGFS
ncbi:MAG: RHS repeat-associated core domain-containing protein, partial [Gemmatimonadales bacterium]